MATSYYLVLLLLIAASASLPANCNLSKHHYRSSCPQALSIVQAGVKAALGGPSWKVRLERRDSTTVSRTAANTSIRRPTSNLSVLISNFMGSLIEAHGQELFNGNSANSLVKRYADDISVFVKDFPRATIMMGNISPLTGSAGQIRINCRKVN
ncbi:hypothetical protein WN943_018225 [Citrus x changshan-huyou]